MELSSTDQYELDPNANSESPMQSPRCDSSSAALELFGLWGALRSAGPSMDLSIMAWSTVLDPEGDADTVSILPHNGFQLLSW